MDNLLDTAFEQVIYQRAIHHTLGISAESVRQYRKRVKDGDNIPTDTKMALLHKSGWRPAEKDFTRVDLVSLLNFYKTTSQAARDNGPEYVIEKWERVNLKVK